MTPHSTPKGSTRQSRPQGVEQQWAYETQATIRRCTSTELRNFRERLPKDNPIRQLAIAELERRESVEGSGDATSVKADMQPAASSQPSGQPQVKAEPEANRHRKPKLSLNQIRAKARTTFRRLKKRPKKKKQKSSSNSQPKKKKNRPAKEKRPPYLSTPAQIVNGTMKPMTQQKNKRSNPGRAGKPSADMSQPPCSASPQPGKPARDASPRSSKPSRAPSTRSPRPLPDVQRAPRTGLGVEGDWLEQYVGPDSWR